MFEPAPLTVRNFCTCVLLAAVVLISAGASAAAADEQAATTSLFNGKSLAGWMKTAFGGEGDVEVKDGRIVMHTGSPMTGITWTGKYPKMNYEVSCQAMRMDGSDFFCGLTFPVGDSPCSFIVGGWGGGVVGLSSLNGSDASENETTKYQEFESDRWYTIRVRVTEERIEAWIDKRRMVDAETEGVLPDDRGLARNQGSQAGRYEEMIAKQ
jgi:hypothetical protein